jgi:hypothetical protein
VSLLIKILLKYVQPSYSARRHSKFLFHESHEKGEWLPSLVVSCVFRIVSHLSCLPGLGVCCVFRTVSHLSCLPGLGVCVVLELGRTCLDYQVFSFMALYPLVLSTILNVIRKPPNSCGVCIGRLTRATKLDFLTADKSHSVS